MRPLWIFGGSSFAEIAVHYFTRDTDYEVQGLIMDSGFEPVDGLRHLPVRRPEEMPAVVESLSEVHFHVAVTYADMNRLRVDKISQLESLGMIPASYVSRHAYVDDSATMGDHIFIFEDNTVQPFVEIRSGVVLWSGNHVGHHSVVEEGVFVSSHVVISGHCRIGERSFLGVNSSVANNVSIGRSNWILPNTFVSRDTGEDEFWKPALSSKSDRPASARAT